MAATGVDRVKRMMTNWGFTAEEVVFLSGNVDEIVSRYSLHLFAFDGGETVFYLACKFYSSYFLYSYKTWYICLKSCYFSRLPLTIIAVTFREVAI